MPRIKEAGERGRPAARHIFLAVLLWAFFAVFLIWPIWQILAVGFTRKDGNFTLAYAVMVFQDPVLLAGLRNATLVAVAVTILSALMAIPLAILNRFEFPGRAILGALLLVPLVLPPFVGGMGLRLAFSRWGPLTMLVGSPAAGIDWLGRYRLAGIIVVEALHLYPVMLLNMMASLAAIDPAMEQAAANLGAGRWTTFRRVTLPLVRPGLFAGATLTLIWSFTELGTPLIFDFDQIAPVQIYEKITDVADNPLPYALVVVMLAASLLLYGVGALVLGKPYDSPTQRAAVAPVARRLTGWRGALAAVPFVLVIGISIIPHLCVIFTSFSATGQWYRSVLPARWTLGHYGQALSDELAMPSVLNSIRYAALATLAAVGIALAAGVIVVRSNVPGRRAIDAMTMLPLAVPGLVLAFGYLALSVSVRHWLSVRGLPSPPWLDVQSDPLLLLVIAYTVRRLPYAVRAIAAGLEQTPADLERAARNLGAPARTVLVRITMPLIMANLAAGAILAFAFSMLEVSDSLILARKESYFPITRAIFELVSSRLGDGAYIASALGVWAMILLALALLAARSLFGNKSGDMFRA
jgi:iron(III) transport system permease protein